MSMMSETMQLQMGHVSVRKYQDKQIDEKLLEQIIRCGQAASSSSFVQAYSLIRVTDAKARKKISEAAGGQPWVIQAPEFFVICGDLIRINEACVNAQQGKLEGLSEQSLVAVIDAALVAQNMLLAAESAGLGGVFIGGIRNNPATLIEQCALPHYVIPLFGLCLGWPDRVNESKPRMPVNMIVHENNYKSDDLAQNMENYDEMLHAYYEARSENKKDSRWSRETANAIQGKKREHMAKFLQQQGFFLG